MKYRNIIKLIFEQEEQKEVKHIKTLEKQILTKIHDEESLDREMGSHFQSKRSIWNVKVPYLLAITIIVVFLISATTSSVSAKGSVMEVLINLRNALQQELTNLLTNDLSYRNKNSQKYQQAQEEWCSVSARSPEQREVAVAAIRDFLDRPDAKVEYECIRNPKSNSNEQPQTESYIVNFDRFIIDTKTNRVIEMSPKEGTWGKNKDGTLWFSPQKQYDYTPRYTQSQVEQIAQEFIASHEKALGKLNLNNLTLKAATKDGGEGRINYVFIWKGEQQYRDSFTPQLTITFTQGGQLISFFNELSK